MRSDLFLALRIKSVKAELRKHIQNGSGVDEIPSTFLSYGVDLIIIYRLYIY